MAVVVSFEIDMSYTLKDFLSGQFTKEDVLEAFIKIYLNHSGLAIEDIELVEDRTHPSAYRYYLRPKVIEENKLDS